MYDRWIDRDRWDAITAQRDQHEQEARDKLAKDIERVLAEPYDEPEPEVAPDTTPTPIAPPEPLQAPRPAQTWGSGEWGATPPEPPPPDPLDDVPEPVLQVIRKLLGIPPGGDR